MGWRVLLYVMALATALLTCRVQAASVPLNVGTAVTRSAVSTSGYVTNAASAFSGAAFNNGMTTQVGGRSVTVPATWRLAANAGQVALTAVRTTPLGAAASIAATLLASYGIQQCVNGSLGGWCVYDTQEHAPNGRPYSAISSWASNVGTHRYATPEEACMDTPGAEFGQTFVRTVPSGAMYYCEFLKVSGIKDYWGPVQRTAGCLAGDLLSGDMCIPPGYVGPDNERAATDTEWAKVSPDVFTASDALLNALGKDGAFLDITPKFAAEPQVVPLSDPYIDPVTGRRFRDVATVQPNPDGKTADVQIAKQEVDANGDPAKDASGAPASPQKQEDPCVGHEDRLGCMTAGDIPQGPDLGKDERTISITPDSGWGSDTAECPADLTTTLRQGGQIVAFSFKPVCDGADVFRPVVIGLAWIGAVLIALGVGRKGD
jgi:hypothetical protein